LPDLDVSGDNGAQWSGRKRVSGTETVIYKIAPHALWAEALAAGCMTGSEHDRRDGFIHFSTRDQLAETARRHFSGQPDLVLLAVRVEPLGTALRWEPSRGGDLFPHLYAPMPTMAVCRTWMLPLGSDGVPALPEDLA
jgi:uncharacterized protein (DUF952 family)